VRKPRAKPCPICERIREGRTIARNRFAAAIFDGYPVTEGHALVVPLRHEADFFRLLKQEQYAVLGLLREAAAGLRVFYDFDGEKIDGFNVGINVGEAAGQTVGHAHVHLIPRRKGDVEDPRGGVRWVIPAKAKYWKDKK